MQPQVSEIGFHMAHPFGKNGVSDSGSAIKSEANHSVPSTYFQNGSYPVQTEHDLLASCYPPQNYAVAPHSSNGTFSSGGLDIHGGLPPPPSYDQFRIPPPMISDVHDQEYWNGSDDKSDEQYENEPPAKRARSEVYSLDILSNQCK